MNGRSIAEHLDRFRVQHLLHELDAIAARQREVLAELRELLGGRAPHVDRPLEDCPKPGPDTG